jgi:hypothetical protein
MGAGKNHAQAPHAMHVKPEEAVDAAIAPPGEGRKSATTTNPQVMPYLTSKSVGASSQKKRRLGRHKVLGEGCSAI